MSLPDDVQVVGDSDAVPSGLLTAIQESIVGHHRKQWTKTFLPTVEFINNGTCTTVTNPANAGYAFARKIISNPGTGATAWFQIPCDDGDTVVGWTAMLYGNGTVFVQGNLLVWTDIANAANLNATNPTFNNVPAAWTPFTPAPVTPHLMAAGEQLWGQLGEALAAGSTWYIGGVTVTFQRKP